MSQTPTDTVTSIDDSTVEKWHSLSTIKYVGFTSKNMSDFERIITAFTKLPKTQAMLAFYDQLTQHILDSRAHNLNLDDVKDTLIGQLYHTYRDLGYTGSRRDMLFAMVKTIEVGTVDECVTSFDDTKAVPVTGWQAMFKEHSTDPQTHASFFNSLLPNNALNEDPDFYLSSFFGEQNYLIENEGYTIDHWATKQGTLYLSISYDLRADKNTEIEIMKLHFLPFNFRFVLSHEPNDVNIKEVTLVIWKEFNDDIHQTQLVGALKLAFPDEGYDRFLLVYSHGKCLLRTMISQVEVATYPLIDQAPYMLSLTAPLKDRATAEHVVTIKEVAHYNTAASTTEQLFFLN